MPAHVRREPATYNRDAPYSFFRDLQRVKLGDAEASSAELRLKQHQHETRVDAAERRGEAPPEGTEFRVALNETVGTGGTFAPPKWVIDLYAEANVASRPLADRTPTIPLPAGCQAITIPRWSTGQTTAPTGAQNTAPSQTVPVDVTAGLTSQVAAIAGQVPVSQQWLEQTPSPPGADAVIYNGLKLSYDQQLENQLLVGTGTGGQLLGLANVTGIVALTFTNASPTVPLLWPFMGQAMGQIADTRGLPATDIFMAPRRWAWIVSSLDAQSRINFAGPGNYGNLVSELGGEQVYGHTAPKSIDGLPTWEDGSIPLNLGAGTNQDEIFVTRPTDHMVFEGEPQVLVNFEQQAQNLTTIITFHRYCAFFGNRYPASTATINGTGLVGPASF